MTKAGDAIKEGAYPFPVIYQKKKSRKAMNIQRAIHIPLRID